MAKNLYYDKSTKCQSDTEWNEKSDVLYELTTYIQALFCFRPASSALDDADTEAVHMQLTYDAPKKHSIPRMGASCEEDNKLSEREVVASLRQENAILAQMVQENAQRVNDLEKRLDAVQRTQQEVQRTLQEIMQDVSPYKSNPSLHAFYSAMRRNLSGRYAYSLLLDGGHISNRAESVNEAFWVAHRTNEVVFFPIAGGLIAGALNILEYTSDIATTASDGKFVNVADSISEFDVIVKNVVTTICTKYQMQIKMVAPQDMQKLAEVAANRAIKTMTGMTKEEIQQGSFAGRISDELIKGVSEYRTSRWKRTALTAAAGSTAKLNAQSLFEKPIIAVYNADKEQFEFYKNKDSRGEKYFYRLGREEDIITFNSNPANRNNHYISEAPAPSEACMAELRKQYSELSQQLVSAQQGKGCYAS